MGSGGMLKVTQLSLKMMSYENAALMFNVHMLGLDCGGSSGQGWDNNPCTKMDISTNSASAESTSISSFCYGVGSTCQSKVLSYNKKLTLRAPGVVLTKYFVSGSKVPRVHNTFCSTI